MAGPPQDVPANELWLKLSEPKPSEIVDFPRKGSDGKPVGRVRIQVLRMEDHNRARMAAHEELKKFPKKYGMSELAKVDMESPAVLEVVADLTAHEILCMAVLWEKPAPGSEEDGKPFYPRQFRDPDDLREKLTADETLVLFNNYLLVQAKYGPFEKFVDSPEDINAWIRRLQEGADAFPLLRLSLPQLVELTSSLAGRLSSLSRFLESQRESLPSSLAADLESFCLGTGSYGEPLDEQTLSYSDVSTETAARMAERQKSDRIG